MRALATVIIPAYQHGYVISDALYSVSKQTVPCDCIVINDGSTDATIGHAQDFGAVHIAQEHSGVAAARNAGIERATTEYLMFLDADDTIEPTKVERQIAELEAHPESGWCFCDTRIIDAVSGKDEPASKRYGYAGMNLNGDISPLLAERNFIPVHAPLIWRPALGDIRFRDGPLEDWAFWRELAAVSLCRYVPEVLATYRAGKNGRNRKRAA